MWTWKWWLTLSNRWIIAMWIIMAVEVVIYAYLRGVVAGAHMILGR